MQNISMTMARYEHEMQVRMGVEALSIKDNSTDERYPFIFQNVPVEGQKELVSLSVH
jgi:hypothetical protein